MGDPVILRAGPGYFITDRPIGTDPVVVYVEDFPTMALRPGDRLRIAGNGWEAEAVAKLRHPPTAPRRERRPNKKNRRLR